MKSLNRFLLPKDRVIESSHFQVMLCCGRCMDLKNLDGLLCGGTLLPSFQLPATDFLLLQLLMLKPVYSRKKKLPHGSAED